MNYPHLTREERYQIYTLKKAGHSQSELAPVIDRSGSTISRELARNCGARDYRRKQAHNHAVERKAVNARAIDDATWQVAQEKLMLQRSPDQISYYADISSETVYQGGYAGKRNGGFLGTRNEREYQWTDSAVFPKKQGLHQDYTTENGYSNGKI